MNTPGKSATSKKFFLEKETNSCAGLIQSNYFQAEDTSKTVVFNSNTFLLVNISSVLRLFPLVSWILFTMQGMFAGAVESELL